MTSQAQAISPLPAVRGLSFFGFPLHATGKPSAGRAEHLLDVRVPMLFLQGDRDGLADMSLIMQVVAGLGQRASLHVVAHADHSFHVTKRSGTTVRALMHEMLDVASAWIATLARSTQGNPGS
jgi:predicted alpha/beta-hydrolase family hydrolase